jgi:hypothetical protein
MRICSAQKKALLARHYSDERLAAGRARFVEPDRQPLP